jgi:class 3 adenylate cyclase
MKTKQDIEKEVRSIFVAHWKARDGQVVPEVGDIQMGNEAVNIEGAVLYADMADSTDLVNRFRDSFAAEVYKSFLVSTCHIIRNNDGVITAFDGDRVMAVFIGKNKCSQAAKTALQIKWMVMRINTLLKEVYTTSSFILKHSVGVDVSKLFVAKTGIWGSNDLVWVGRAANYAAKLSAMRDVDASSFITEDVFSRLADSSKYGGDPKRCMWHEAVWNETGVGIYKSDWYWELS